MFLDVLIGMAVTPWLLTASVGWNLDAVPVITAPRPGADDAAREIHDHGRLFGREAERRAEDVLRDIGRQHRAAVRLETVRSLEGAWIADVAQRRARKADGQRLYILVAGQERDVGVIGARYGPAHRLSDQQRETIRRSFLEPLQRGEPDEAIARGVQAIAVALDDAAAARRASRPLPRLTAAVLMVLLLILWSTRSRRRSRRGVVAGRSTLGRDGRLEGLARVGAVRGRDDRTTSPFPEWSGGSSREPWS